MYACQVYDKADGTADVPAQVSDEEGGGNAPAGGNGAGGEGEEMVQEVRREEMVQEVRMEEMVQEVRGEEMVQEVREEKEMEEMEMEEMEVNLIQKEKMKTRKRMRKSRRKEIPMYQKHLLVRRAHQRKIGKSRVTRMMISFKNDTGSRCAGTQPSQP